MTTHLWYTNYTYQSQLPTLTGAYLPEELSRISPPAYLSLRLPGTRSNIDAENGCNRSGSSAWRQEGNGEVFWHRVSSPRSILVDL